MSTETIQYRLNLANTLHAISPGIAALHTARAAALHPEASAILHPTHCTKCGSYRFSCPPTRKKRKRTPSSLQRACHVCGFSMETVSPPHASPTNLSRTARIPATGEIGQASPSTCSSRPIAATVSTISSTPVPSFPSRQTHPKPSHAKTPTLKDMLSRDRQREESAKAQKNKKEGHEGLAAFLKEL